MSKKQEKKSPLELLKFQLDKLGFADHIAAKHLLNCLEPSHIGGEVVEAVNSMVSIAVSKTKKKCKSALQSAIDAL